MTGLAFSRLASELIAEHRSRPGANGLQVVPVVCPGVTPDDPGAAVLHQAVIAESGLILSARDLAGGVTGARTTLADEIERIMPDPDDPGRPRVVLTEDAGRVLVTLADGSSPIGSSGTETLAGMAVAPLDSRLRGTEIAMLVYDEAVLDRPAADGIWQLVCLHLNIHDFGQLRTLIVLCHVGQIESGRHYGMYRSARYIVRAGHLAQRRSWPVDREEVRRLAVEATAPIALFIGAGFCASSQTTSGPLPMGNALRDRALRRLIGDFSSEREAAVSFREFCANRGGLLPREGDMSIADFERGLTFERVLNVEFSGALDPLGVTLNRFAREVEEAKRIPGEAVLKLAEMLRAGKRIVLVTVNLDDITEHVCEDLVEPFHGEPALSDAAAAIMDYIGGADRPAPLVKLHGDLRDPASIVATVQSVARGLSEAKIAALDALLAGDGENPRLLFYVGASMRDRDIAQLIGLPRYAERLDEWWVAPALDQSVDSFLHAHRLEPWERAGRGRIAPIQRCITLTADVFMTQLSMRLA